MCLIQVQFALWCGKEKISFRILRFRILVCPLDFGPTKRSQNFGPFRKAFPHFRRFSFHVSLLQFRDSPNLLRTFRAILSPFRLDPTGASIPFPLAVPVLVGINCLVLFFRPDVGHRSFRCPKKLKLNHISSKSKSESPEKNIAPKDHF